MPRSSCSPGLLLLLSLYARAHKTHVMMMSTLTHKIARRKSKTSAEPFEIGCQGFRVAIYFRFFFVLVRDGIASRHLARVARPFFVGQFICARESAHGIWHRRENFEVFREGGGWGGVGMSSSSVCQSPSCRAKEGRMEP